MKKILPLLLLFTGIINAQILDIPDANFKAELLSSSPIRQVAQDFNDNWIKLDANDDGEIQISEAQAVKNLNIAGQLIFNVNGLSGFSNLEAFNIGNSFVTTLDVSALTHLKTLACYNLQILSNLNVNSNTSLIGLNGVNLPRLTTLSLGNLVNLTKLSLYGTGIVNFNANGLIALTELLYYANTPTTTVTVNGLTNLVKLDCAYNSNLGILNLSGLTALTQLNCSGNHLTNLNGVPNVTKLNCENNQLTALNLNGLTNLTELSCGGNELTSLNVNALTSLTKLDCQFTKITTLSITGLTNLTTLNCNNNKDLTSLTLTNLPNLEEFNVVGIVNTTGDVLSSLTSLNMSGLPNVQKIVCTYGKLTSLDLTNLTSLKELYCSGNLLTSMNLINLPNLQKLDCSRNRISTLDATNLPALTDLTCGGYIEGGQFVAPFLTNLNVDGLTNLKYLNCSSNALTSLDLTGLPNLETLYCGGLSSSSGHITSLSVNHLANLKKLSCSFQALTSLDVSNLVNLTDLNCDHNNISTLNLTGLVNLKTLDYTYNQLANLSLVNLPSLESLFCGHNQLVTLNVLDLTNLKTLWCANNQLTTLNLNGLSSLESLDISFNELSLADVSGLSANLEFLSCMSNNLTSLDVSGLTNLSALHCQNNNLTSLDVSSLTNLQYFTCSYNQLTNLNMGSLQHLETLECSNNQLTNVDISGVGSSLYSFNCSYNQLTSIDLSAHYNLISLGYSYNAIPNLDLSAMTNLKNLDLESTQTTVLDVSHMTNLESLDCALNQITTVDVNNCPNLNYLYCANNSELITIFMKNGKNEQSFELSNTPNLQYICADSGQLESIQTQLNGLGMSATVCNSYCTFTPGGNHNTITGITIFDANNDGCDVTDEVNPFIRLNINDTSVDGATVTNINGTYNFYTDAGEYVISPNTENPTWFDFSPASANFSFLYNNNNISTQNFCITAVGLHKDIEVVFSQVEAARPGFDARYKIVFKNKGNQMQSGSVNLQFDDSRTDFVSSSPDVDVTATNSLTWNFTNLMPFENRSIILTLNINEPGDTPAVNNGDILDFTATVTPIAGDEFPTDNEFEYSQIVVGSYDPNEIVCLEGTTVSPTEIGKYLHYMVNFENLGTFYAENVVVRLDIDDAKFDMNSLQLLNSSNPSSTRIFGHTVEFVLEDINLAAAAGTPPVGGHGDVLFKIKTKENLAANDTVLQRAGIYFDYNFPVVTNDAETVFAELSNPISEFDNSVKIYPNPTNSFINISSEFGIESIELYDIQGRILETHFETSTFTKLDISGKSNGIYFLKIKTEKGSKVEKIVKE